MLDALALYFTLLQRPIIISIDDMVMGSLCWMANNGITFRIHYGRAKKMVDGIKYFLAQIPIPRGLLNGRNYYFHTNDIAFST